MEITKPVLLIIFILGLLGCGINSSDEIERTYPEAFRLETVTIQQLLYEVETPDSLNINAYVVEIHECPEGAVCVLPDHITVSESLSPSDTLYITAIEPKQFQKEEEYQISLKVSERESKEQHDIRLMGYSLIE